MTIGIVLQFAVVLAAIWMGARYGGAGLVDHAGQG